MHWSRSILTVGLCALAVAFVLAPLAAHADPFVVTVSDDTGASQSYWPVPNGSDGNFAGTWTPTSDWSSTYNVTVDSDPAVTAIYSIQNVANVPHQYTVISTLPISALTPGATIGSVSGSVTYGFNNGLTGVATVSSTGSLPFYQSQINGNNWVSLYNGPGQSFSTLPFPGSSSATVPGASFGPTLYSGPAATSIGIVLNFTLSPGDTASFTSVFAIVPVPEPSSVVMAACGALALVGIAIKRRKS
jgi:hypothetical protein